MTRHVELLFWSTIQEAWSKKYSVKKYRGFKFMSTQEAWLWDSSEFKKTSIPFYVFLSELKNIKVLFEKTGKTTMVQKSGHAKKKLSLILRLASLSIVSDSILSDSIDSISVNKFAGNEQLRSILKISRSFGVAFKKSLYFTDPSFFIQDTFGATEHINSSDIFKRVAIAFSDIFDAFLIMDDVGFFELFYDFADSLRNHFLPQVEASTEDKQILLLQEGFLWCSNEGDNTFFSIIFGGDEIDGAEDKIIIFFLDIARIYYHSSEPKINTMRQTFFGRILQEFIINKASTSGNFVRMSSGLLANMNDEKTLDFFSASYNSYIIAKYEKQISAIIEEELVDIKNLESYLDLEASSRVHSIVLLNVVEKLSSLISSSRGGAILYVHNKEARQPFTEDLAKIIKNTYLTFLEEKLNGL